MEDIIKLKKQLMRTRIFFFITLVVCVLFFVFAYVQKLEADRQTELSIQLRQQAQQMSEMAKASEAEAIRQREIALQAAVAAKEALDQCQKKSK